MSRQHRHSRLSRLTWALLPGRPIAVDCDGVILDFDQVFPLIGEHALGRPLPRLNRIYELDVRYGLTPDDLGRVFQAYLTHPQGWQGLPLIDGAASVLRALRALGHPLHVVTGIDPALSDLRVANLAAHGIEIDDIHCVGMGRQSKRDVIARLDPGMFFDDRLHLLEEVPAVPHRVWIDRNDDQGGLECPDGIERVASLTEWFESIFRLPGRPV